MNIKLTVDLGKYGSVETVSGTKEDILRAIENILDDSVEQIDIIKKDRL